MKDKSIIHNLILKEDETLSIKKKVLDDTPRFFMIGNGTMNKNNIQSINLTKEIINSSKRAQRVIEWIIDGMTWNYIDEQIEFVIKIVPATDADKQTLLKGFKELYDRDLVRRVKRSHYMINPHAIITDHKKQLKVWNTCKPSKHVAITDNTQSPLR